MIKFLDLQKITAKYAEEFHAAAARVIDSGWYLQGKENERFEADYARYIGAKHCVGCGNGLDALIWIFRAYLELGVFSPGDEVVVPANTYIATILAITENGLVPVLVEPREDTLQIDDSKIESALTPRTKAVCIVHLYGRCAYTERIGALCRSRGLKLIEDNAQAHGCMFKGTKTGNLGDAAGHSFYPGKNLGAFGDGGAVTTNDAALAETVRSLANYGSTRKYVFRYRGRNSRLDEIQAAILGVKLSHLDEDLAARKAVAEFYIENLKNPSVRVPAVPERDEHVFHLFPILCSRRDALQRFLADRGVQTLIHYPIPPHRQECYKEWNSLSFPITERLSAEELSLPISPVMTPEEVRAVVETVNAF